MRNKPHHFIKQWRKSKGLSLRKLANRLVDENFNPIISYASLSRIEKGDQPYTQDTLEALADALSCDAADLITRTPESSKTILLVWDKIPEADKPKALEVLQAFMKKDGTDG